MNSGDYINKYKFGGKEQDKESDLQYFEARYYDNEIGRFESIDRVFWEVGETERGEDILYFPQKQNSYTYSRNNPLKYIDPNGEYDQLVDGGVAVVGYWYGKLTGDVYLQKGAEKMLKETVKDSVSVQNLVLSKINKIKKVAELIKKVDKIIDKVDNTSAKAKEKLREKLLFEEAKDKTDFKIPKEQIGDSKYEIDGVKSYDKNTYDHKSLDGTQTQIHYMENPKTGETKDFKIIPKD